MEAAKWFHGFRDTLLRADLPGSPERAKGSKKSRGRCSEEATDRLLAVFEGNAKGIDVAASSGAKKCEWSVCGSKSSKLTLAGLRSRGMNSRWENAALSCW